VTTGWICGGEGRFSLVGFLFSFVVVAFAVAAFVPVIVIAFVFVAASSSAAASAAATAFAPAFSTGSSAITIVRASHRQRMLVVEFILRDITMVAKLDPKSLCSLACSDQ